MEVVIARTRFDSLLSRTPRLIDTQVLDGIIFLDVNPSQLINSLRRSDYGQLPFEIMSRAPDLSQAVVNLVRPTDPSQKSLKGFSFSAISPGARSNIQKELVSVPTNRIKDWHDLVSLLKDMEAPPEDVDRVERGWTKWIKAQEKGLIKVVPWQGVFPLDNCLSNYPLIMRRLATDKGRDLIKWAYDKRYDRSLIDQWLSAEWQTASPEEREDIIAIESWFHHGYNRAIASQHGCSNVESVYDSWLQDTKVGAKIWNRLHWEGQKNDPPEAALDLPPEFIRRLGSMPYGDYRSIIWKQDRYLREWWASGDEYSLKKAFAPFVEACLDQPEKISLVERFLINGGFSALGPVIGASVGAIVGGPMGFATGTMAGGLVSASSLLVEHVLDNKVLKKEQNNLFQRIIHIARKRGRH